MPCLRRLVNCLFLFALMQTVVPAPLTEHRSVFRQDMEWLQSMRKQCGPGNYFSLHDQTCKQCNNGGDDYKECKGFLLQKQLDEINDKQNLTVISLEEIKQQQEEERATNKHASNTSTVAVIISIISSIAAISALFAWCCHLRAHKRDKLDLTRIQSLVQKEVKNQMQQILANQQPVQ